MNFSKNAHACGLRDCLGVSRPFVSETSPKCIDREGLKRRRTSALVSQTLFRGETSGGVGLHTNITKNPLNIFPEIPDVFSKYGSGRITTDLVLWTRACSNATQCLRFSKNFKIWENHQRRRCAWVGLADFAKCFLKKGNRIRCCQKLSFCARVWR